MTTLPPTTDQPTTMSRHAPELIALIQKGILDRNLKLCPEYVERRIAGTRQFLKAPTLGEMKHAYRKDATRLVHQVRMQDENVRLDAPTVFTLASSTFKDKQDQTTFVDEWQYLVHLMFENMYNAA